MKLSYYEVYITSLRAFSGMGFPYGADEEAAYMVSWLELNKLNGVKLLADTYKKFDNKFDAIVNFDDINTTSFNLKNVSLLMKGPGLFDYYETQLQNNKDITVSLTNCIDPLYLLPLMFKSLKKINYCKALWNDNKKKHIICEAKKNLIQFRATFDSKIKNKKQVDLFFSTKNKKITNSKHLKHAITLKTMQNNLALSLSPKDKDWKIISKIAQRTLVPESQESRIKGAGGGDAND